MQEAKQNNEAYELAVNRIHDIAGEIVSVKAQIDEIKPLYEKLDKLTMQLKEGLTALGISEVRIDEKAVQLHNGSFFLSPAQFVTVVDNFESKNVIFRPAGVRRFEIHTESVEARELKMRKEIEKNLGMSK